MRLDAGTPLSALGRSVGAGPGEVFVIERGSLGRSRWTGALDAAVTAGRRVGRARLLLLLEGFNLTNSRRSTARDEVYSDDPVSPAAGGSGRPALSSLRGPAGQEVAARGGFHATTSWTEPRLVRLSVRLEL